jgi:hypothetical protein
MYQGLALGQGVRTKVGDLCEQVRDVWRKEQKEKGRLRIEK